MDPSHSTDDLSDHPLGRLEPLVPAGRPSHIPFTAFDAMVGMYGMGTDCAAAHEARLEKIARACEPTAALLLQGAFLCGLGTRGTDPRTGRHLDRTSLGHSCAGVKRFSRAFLAMTRRDRERAFVAAKSAAGRQDLVISIVGALCEAHVASALSDAGLTVLESAVDDDLDLEIDQLALFSEASSGLLVQVKGDRDATGLEFLPVARTDGTFATWEKAERFNQANSTRLSPVLVRVGTGNGGLFNYRDPDRLAAAKISLARLRDPT